MEVRRNEFILYGLAKHMETMDKIIKDIEELTTPDICFEIKLILAEALTNAYKHGNKNDSCKPIYVRYVCNETILKIEVEDCGCGNGLQNIRISETISEDNLLNDAGRGLYLIKCLTNKIEMNNNRLIVEKQLA
jgi:serine/threonine-protein kinase RsbW